MNPPIIGNTAMAGLFTGQMPWGSCISGGAYRASNRVLVAPAAEADVLLRMSEGQSRETRESRLSQSLLIILDLRFLASGCMQML